MKRLITISLLLLAVGLSAQSMKQIAIPDTTHLKTIKAANKGEVVYLKGLSAANAGGGGWFVDTTATFIENGGIAFDNTGQVSRQWARKEWLENPGVVKIEWFGGRADNSTDNTRPFRKALSFDSTRGGGTILFGAGTYRVRQLVVRNVNKIVIKGIGPQTIIRNDWNSALPYVSATYGYFAFYIDNCSDIEMCDFTYDGKGDSITTTAYPKFCQIGSAAQGAVTRGKFHHINLTNGGEIQDKGAFNVYGAKDCEFYSNNIVGYDVAFMMTNKLTHGNFIDRNIIIGGKSEAINVWTDTDEAFIDSTAKPTVISNNYIVGKATGAIVVEYVNPANVNILGNDIVTTALDGIRLINTSGVNITGNSIYGNTFGIRYRNVRNISITSNNIKTSQRFIASYPSTVQAPDGNTNSFMTISHNTCEGFGVDTKSYDPTHAYNIGEVVLYPHTVSGLLYICKNINGSTGNLPTNTTYWTAMTVSTTDDGIEFYASNSTLDHNTVNNNTVGTTHVGICLGNHNGAPIGDVYDVSVDHNTVYALGKALSSGFSDLRNVTITHNKFKSAVQAALLYRSSMKNVLFDGNQFESEATIAANVDIGSYYMENVKFINNTVLNLAVGAGEIGLTLEGTHYSPNVALANNYVKSGYSIATGILPISGYVTKGTMYNKVDVDTATYVGYICTTAGYCFREVFDPTHHYLAGESVKGSDSKVYKCILATSVPAGAAQAPTTGGDYATYWELVDAVGTPLAAFKQYGILQ